MDSTKYETLAENTLHEISELLENSDEEGELDIDYLDGVLKIILPDNKEYVINKHLASQKIWMSSPKSGASYYVLNENSNKWLTADGIELFTILKKELGQWWK